MGPCDPVLKKIFCHSHVLKKFFRHTTVTGKKIRDTQSPFTVDMGPDGSYEYTDLTQKMHRKCIKTMHFLCQTRVLVRSIWIHVHCEWVLLFLFLHCVVWWPGASFGGQAPRWYPRFTLGDLFVTTLRVKWPGASFGGQAPRWYPRFGRVGQKKKKEKIGMGPFTVSMGPDGSYEYTGLTQKMHDFHAFSVSILCYHETYLYHCPL